MRVYSLALFKKTKANKASESLFVCARRIIMAELPNNEKEAKKPKTKPTAQQNAMPKQKQRLARLRLKKKRVQSANAKRIAPARSVLMLLQQSSARRIANAA